MAVVKRWLPPILACGLLGTVGLVAMTGSGCEGCFMDNRVRETTIEIVNAKATLVEVCDAEGRCEVHTSPGSTVVVADGAEGGAFSDCVHPSHSVKVTAPGCAPFETTIPSAVSTTRALVTVRVTAALACSP